MKNKIKYILGIHDGHNCGASLIKEGIVVVSISEERLTRNKNEIGYPKLSIEECLKIEKIDSIDLDEIVYASNFMHTPEHLASMEEWYLVGKQDQDRDKNQPKTYQKIVFENRLSERIDIVCKHLSISKSKISFVEHHLAHLAAAYYTAPNVSIGKKVLGLTCDGAGDGLSATVSICQGNSINRISSTSRDASLGKIYSRITMLAGFKPWEHEYKIMGLAPYADQQKSYLAAEPLRNLLKLSQKSLKFILGEGLSTNYCYYYLRDNFERIRFDVLAGAVQLYTEEMLIKWVKAAIKRTSIHDIVCGGGVFMNVKANMLIQQLPEVRSMYVMPSAADESLSIGAALQVYYQKSKDEDHKKSIFNDLYLGKDLSGSEIKSAVNKLNSRKKIYVYEPQNINDFAAKKLSKGEIISVCRGRMEWGARALGNRSIIVGAESKEKVEIINSQIKMRDFWMPFAPSILDADIGKYIDDKKNILPEFMTFAMPTKKETLPNLIAATHPVDKTCRPQVVTKMANPAFHKFLTNYKKYTGVSGVLQTSFNIHGEPMVNSARDACDTFIRSGLQNMILDKYYISKKDLKI